MNMNSNIKRGTSINGGMVLTDMPIEALKAMRDSIDDAIRSYQEQEKDKYATDIQAAIDAARDTGYNVCINGMPYEDADDIELYESDEDEDNDEYWDEDEDEDNDDWDDVEAFPCYHCERPSCANCPHS